MTLTAAVNMSPAQGSRVMDRESLWRALRNCKPGESVVYHVGYLARDRDETLNANWKAVAEIAREANELCADGVVALKQKKLGYCNYIYMAEKLKDKVTA